MVIIAVAVLVPDLANCPDRYVSQETYRGGTSGARGRIAHVAVDHGDQIGEVERLGDEFIAPRPEGLVAIARTAESADGDDWNVARRWIGLEPPREGEAVDLR